MYTTKILFPQELINYKASYYADPATATEYATELLVKAGLSEEDAKSMADCLVLADVRGVVSVDHIIPT